MADEKPTYVRRFYVNPKLNDKAATYITGGSVTEAPEAEANLIGSTIGDIDADAAGPFHLPVLDIDFPARLEPSSSPGHYHLYLDGMRPLTWERYKALLHALADAGVIHPNYYFASVRREQTLVRKPGERKPVPEPIPTPETNGKDKF